MNPDLALTMTLSSKADRADVIISLARDTWFMEDNERFDARRRETRVSRGGTVLDSLCDCSILSVDDAIKLSSSHIAASR